MSVGGSRGGSVSGSAMTNGPAELAGVLGAVGHSTPQEKGKLGGFTPDIRVGKEGHRRPVP